MTYVISDIHGCYEEFMQLLDKIEFSEQDTLYILGDAMDRGPEPIKTIQEIMSRPNIWYILGNHDFMMWATLKKLAVEVTEDSLSALNTDTMLAYYNWMENGGEITAKQFRNLPRDAQVDILDYLEDASIYEVVEANCSRFILVHAGIAGFDPQKSLDDYELDDLLWERADYEREYYPDNNTFLVTGHTPTATIWGEPLIYTQHNHLAIDCGCVFGGNLAAFCFETEQAVYVSSKQK